MEKMVRLTLFSRNLSSLVVRIYEILWLNLEPLSCYNGVEKRLSCFESFAGHSELTVFIKTCRRYLDVTVTPLMLNTRTGVPTTIAPTREYSGLAMLWSPHVKCVLPLYFILFYFFRFGRHSKSVNLEKSRCAYCHR